MSLKLTTISALLLCTMIAGCGQDSAPITSQSTKYEVADDSTGTATPDTSTPQPAASQATAPSGLTDSDPLVSDQVPPRRPDPINQTPASDPNLPDTLQPTPQQLLVMIRNFREQQPKGANQDEMIADYLKIQTQLIQAVDTLLGLKPEDDIVAEVADAKLEALAAVSQLGDEDAMDRAFAFTQELEKHASPKISAFGRQKSFVTLLNAYSTDQVEDVQQVIDAYKKLAEEQPKEGGLLQFGNNVASRLIEKDKNKEAAELLRYTAGLVEPTQDPRLHAAAEQLIEQARFAEVDLRSKFGAVIQKQEGAIEEFAKVLGELTSGETVGAMTLDTLRQIASVLEAEHADAAVKVYDVLEASLGKTSDAEVAEAIKQLIDKYRLRSAIVGKPFELEGVLIDGAPFDWTQYKGKVVLVDFWATWCGPCLQEMPNIRANFELYREHGFEVVGVNIDEQVQEFKDFSAIQPLPWPSVLSADPKAVGWAHPMAAKNGVAAIPFLVLVDRDGTAIALNTRGPALGEKLAELFPGVAPPSETPAAGEPAAANPATEKPAEGKTSDKPESASPE
jgi:thiol-disulfide isomerase/thioredoxin